jgi:tetratricopeptide (TPR) repeat protein
MLDATLSKKLKRVLNPKRFRFVVILYENSLDIVKIKEFISSEYENTNQTTLDVKNKTYAELTEHLYGVNCINYIDDFSVVLENKELYSAFNQRRDKIAMNAMNLIIFYPKKLQTKLFTSASNLIPDFWEFRSAVLTLESSEKEIEGINVKEFGLQYEYSGMNQEEKQKEIERLEKRLKSKSLEDEERGSLLNSMAMLYMESGLYEKAEPLYLKALKISEKLLGEEHPSTATS